MKCPICLGEKQLDEGDGYYPDMQDCPQCDGLGSISLWFFLTLLFWQHAPDWYIEWAVERHERRSDE